MKVEWESPSGQRKGIVQEQIGFRRSSIMHDRGLLNY